MYDDDTVGNKNGITDNLITGCISDNSKVNDFMDANLQTVKAYYVFRTNLFLKVIGFMKFSYGCF